MPTKKPAPKKTVPPKKPVTKSGSDPKELQVLIDKLIKKGMNPAMAKKVAMKQMSANK